MLMDGWYYCIAATLYTGQCTPTSYMNKKRFLTCCVHNKAVSNAQCNAPFSASRMIQCSITCSVKLSLKDSAVHRERETVQTDTVQTWKATLATKS